MLGEDFTIAQEFYLDANEGGYLGEDYGHINPSEVWTETILVEPKDETIVDNVSRGKKGANTAKGRKKATIDSDFEDAIKATQETGDDDLTLEESESENIINSLLQEENNAITTSREEQNIKSDSDFEDVKEVNSEACVEEDFTLAEESKVETNISDTTFDKKDTMTSGRGKKKIPTVDSDFASEPTSEVGTTRVTRKKAAVTTATTSGRGRKKVVVNDNIKDDDELDLESCTDDVVPEEPKGRASTRGTAQKKKIATTSARGKQKAMGDSDFEDKKGASSETRAEATIPESENKTATTTAAQRKRNATPNGKGKKKAMVDSDAEDNGKDSSGGAWDEATLQKSESKASTSTVTPKKKAAAGGGRGKKKVMVDSDVEEDKEAENSEAWAKTTTMAALEESGNEAGPSDMAQKKNNATINKIKQGIITNSDFEEDGFTNSSEAESSTASDEEEPDAYNSDEESNGTTRPAKRATKVTTTTKAPISRAPRAKKTAVPVTRKRPTAKAATLKTVKDTPSPKAMKSSNTLVKAVTKSVPLNAPPARSLKKIEIPSGGPIRRVGLSKRVKPRALSPVKIPPTNLK